jgi:hypothetical protein
MKGWLTAALSGRMRGDEADKVALMLGRLEAALAERGLGHPRVRWVREGDDTLTVALATGAGGARILEAARDDLQRHLGCVVAGIRADRGGVLLALRRVPVALRNDHAAAHAGATNVVPGPAQPPHPVPLLAPLGADAGDGQVVHVNLAHLGSLLIASGPTAGAQPLMVTLVTHVAA